MVPESWLDQPDFGGPDFFLRPLWRQHYFILNSAWLVLDIILFVCLMIRGWSYLSLYTISWVAFALLSLIAFWRVALRTHFNVSILFSTAQVERPGPGTPLSLVLRAAGLMTGWGLFTAGIILGVCLLTMLELVSHGRNGPLY